MSKTRIETFKPPSADDPVLPEVVRRLVEVYHPLRIYRSARRRAAMRVRIAITT